MAHINSQSPDGAVGIYSDTQNAAVAPATNQKPQHTTAPTAQGGGTGGGGGEGVDEVEICRWWWPCYFGGDGDAAIRTSDARLEEVGGVLAWFETDGPNGGASFIRDVSSGSGI